MSDAVLARALAMKSTQIPALNPLWRDLYPSDPPAHTRIFLEKRLAYRMQELATGWLKPSTIERSEQLGEQLDGCKQRVHSRRGMNGRTRLARSHAADAQRWLSDPHDRA